MDATVGSYDEGLVLVGADRVLRGDLPYRDFWTMYGPGSFYVLASLFGLFGEFALVERAFDIATKAAIATLVVALVLKFGRRAVAVAAGIASLGLLVHLRSYSAPLFPALAASLAAVLALHEVSFESRPIPAFLAGIAIGATSCFRHDLGAYVLVAAGLFMIRLAWATVPGPRRTGVLAAAGWVGVGLAVSLVPPVAFFGLNVPTADLYRDFVDIPFSVYPRVRALPFPSITGALYKAWRERSLGQLGALTVYLPLVLLGVAVASELLRRKSPGVRDRLGTVNENDRARTRLLGLLVVLGALFYLKGLVRVSPLHMGASLIVSIVTLGAAIARARHPVWRISLLAAAGIACLALLAKPIITAMERSAGGPLAAALLSDRWIGSAGSLCGTPVVPRLRCLRLEPDAAAVAAYLVHHGASGRRVYVGLGRHDKIFAANLALSFAAGVVPPTRWHDLHPGVQTRGDVQAQMIEELRSARLAYVVLDREWDDVSEPNESAVSSGVTALDDYLSADFMPVFRAGSLTVLLPREGSDP
ncbi:MAG: hypothetical protein ABI224_11265 [Acetobacteraceae bacterium]